MIILPLIKLLFGIISLETAIKNSLTNQILSFSLKTRGLNRHSCVNVNDSIYFDDDLNLKKSIVHKGLRNLGNTCYLNSVVQALFVCSAFRTSVIAATFKESSAGRYLQDIFLYLLDSNGDAEEGSIRSVQLCRQLARKMDINVRIQEDAEEFYLRLLDVVDESLERDDSIPRHLPSSVFDLRLAHIIRCESANETRVREQKYLDLSVDLQTPASQQGHSDQSQEVISLESVIAQVFQTELVSFKVRGQQAQTVHPAEKTVVLKRAPAVLAVHLKRFAYDSESGTMSKVVTAVRIPRVLHLKTENGSASYALTAAVVHEGWRLDFGHYYLLAKEPEPVRSAPTPRGPDSDSTVKTRMGSSLPVLSSEDPSDGNKAIDEGRSEEGKEGTEGRRRAGIIGCEWLEGECEGAQEKWVQLNDHVVQNGVSAEHVDLLVSKGAYMVFYSRTDSLKT